MATKTRLYKSCIFFVATLLLYNISGCSPVAGYGTDVIEETWSGAYQVPGTSEAGTVVATVHKFDGYCTAKVSFRNKTYEFEGSGELSGELLKDNRFKMSGMISDSIQGTSSIVLEGRFQGGTIEGTYRQDFGIQAFAGKYLMTRLPKATNLDGPSSNIGTFAWDALYILGVILDLGANSSGLQNPGNSNAYGPGIHSDSTGRPFQWRTDDGSMPLGEIRPNAYGLGVGSDATGRPVRAVPLW